MRHFMSNSHFGAMKRGSALQQDFPISDTGETSRKTDALDIICQFINYL